MAQTKVNKRVARIFTGLHGSVYKLSKGRIGGTKTEGAHIAVLTTTGRKSGQQRQRPLIVGDHPDGWVAIASFSGHDQHPAWYLNLEAQPEARLLIDGVDYEIKARVTEGSERLELWDQMAALYPDYIEYSKVTDREIPVLVLERGRAG